jgi:hypothetical protein
MSTEKRSQRITVPELRARKGGEPIVCLSASILSWTCCWSAIPWAW